MPNTQTLVRDAARNLLEILEVDVSYPGWERQTAEEKAFYVRGFTWFRDEVIVGKINKTEVQHYIPRMKELIDARSNWQQTEFNWAQPFSIRQFIDAASPNRKLPVKFQKAAEIIVLCEAITAKIHAVDPNRPHSSSIYNHMRVEPAVSFLHGFDRTVISRLQERRNNFIDELTRWTGQTSKNVFYDMADGRTVTHKLVLRTRNYLLNRLPRIEIGPADFRFNAKRIYFPSENEKIDVEEYSLPTAARKTLHETIDPDEPWPNA